MKRIHLETNASLARALDPQNSLTDSVAQFQYLF